MNFIKRILKRRHRWLYSNPFDRVCSVCGRQEVQYCQDMRDYNNPFKGWWEVHKEGNQELHSSKKRSI